MLQTEVEESVVRGLSEQIELDLRGAWRAGYDYLHVYEPVAVEPLDETFRVALYTFPSNTQARPDPDSLRYLHTYDIGSVPDEEISAGVRESSV